VTDEERSKLTKVAAEMVLGNGMPPYSFGGWDLPKTTTVKARREIDSVSQIAHAQCREWARRIMEIVDADRKK
jgi:hypothetical protein